MRGTLKIAWFAHSASGATYVALMFAAWVGIPAASQAENLSELYLPQTGHIEMKAATRMHLTNVDVKTIEDVWALREKLNDGPLDEKSVTSWKFLERADLKIMELDPPPQLLNFPPHQIIRGSDWRNVVLDFDGSLRSFSVESLDQRLQSEVMVGPGSCVELEKAGGQWTYRHFNYVLIYPWQNFNCEQLFSRERFLFRSKYSIRPFGDFELFATPFHFQGQHEMLLVDREQDAVLIRASRWIRADRIDSFTLHLQMKSQESPQPHQVPTVTMRFDREHRVDNTWRCDVYWLEKADFEVTFPPERFVLNVPAKERYHAEQDRYWRWLKAPILDITHKTVKAVSEELNQQ